MAAMVGKGRFSQLVEDPLDVAAGLSTSMGSVTASMRVDVGAGDEVPRLARQQHEAVDVGRLARSRTNDCELRENLAVEDVDLAVGHVECKRRQTIGSHRECEGFGQEIAPFASAAIQLPAYKRSMTSAKRFWTTRRFTFWVGVSSPVSIGEVLGRSPRP